MFFPKEQNVLDQYNLAKNVLDQSFSPNVIARKACEAIDVQRRVVFFSLRANVYTGIRGVVLVVVVACAIFYLSKKSFCARVEFLSSLLLLLLLLFLGTTTRNGGGLFLLLRFVGAHSRVIHDGRRRDLPSVRFFQLRCGILTGLIAKQTFSVRVALIVDDYGSFAVVHPLG